MGESKAISPKYCRPIKLQFISETSDVIREENARMERNLADLDDFEIIDKNIRVGFDLYCTMTDAKVTNAITETSSAMLL